MEDSGAVSIKRRFDLVQVENGWLVRENNGHIHMNHGLPCDRMWIVKRPEDIAHVINEAIASDGKK